MKLGSFPINLRHIGIFLVICIVLVVMMDFNNRLQELFQLQKGVVAVRVEATAVILTQQALQAREAYATSPAAADDYARSQAKLAQPGDVVIGVAGVPGPTAVPTPSPTPVSTHKTNWDIWMKLLFGQ